jgi:hypothetical protein
MRCDKQYTKLISSSSNKLLQISHFFFEHGLKAEGLEWNTITKEMLAHGFDPVQSQTVQHGRCTLHDDQNGNSEEEPDDEEEEDDKGTSSSSEGESVSQGHGPQHDRQLLMSKRQSPETQVRSSVGDTVETELDGVDDLVNHDLGEFKLLVLLTVDVLGDDSSATVITGEALSTVHAVAMVLVVVIVKGADSLALTNSAVTHGSGTVVLPAQVEGLQEEHDGYTAYCSKKQNDLNSSLTRVEFFLDSTRLQEHVDKHVEQTGRVGANGVPVDRPLVDDAEDKVTEDGLEEDHTRNEVAPDVNRSLEVPCVDVGETERVSHVGPTKKNTELHLVTVGEEKIVVGVVPAPIHTEGVSVTFLADHSDGLSFLEVGNFPHRREDGKLLGEGVTVDQTSVHGEDTHHEHDVATEESHGKELVLLGAQERLLPVDHGTGGSSHDETVTEITKHDSEEEGEGDDGRQTRVDFGVLGSTVSVDDGLETQSKSVGLVVSWGSLGSLDGVDDGGNGETSAVVDVLQSRLDESKRVCRAPGLCNQSLALLIVGETVKSLVDGLFLGNNNHPGSKTAANHGQLGIEGALGVGEDVCQILQTSVDLVHLIATQFAVLVDVVDVGTERLGDLTDLVDDLLSMGEDDEDALVHLLVGLGVDDGLLNLALVHVKVTAESTPQDALECGHALTRDDTGDETNVHNRERALA